MDSFLRTFNNQDYDLYNAINTQDLLQFSSGQSLSPSMMLQESEVGLFNYDVAPLSGTEQVERSYNLNAVMPVLPESTLEDLNNVVLEHPDPEHWHKFPTMEIVETKYAFDMHVHPCDNQNWLFSTESKKVYIKLNSVMRLTFSYVPSKDSEKLFLRGMILFASADDMHLEVKRCANHRLSNEYEGAPKEHVLRCCHPETQYMGQEIGQAFKDRLSIVVQLNRPAIDDDRKATESVLLEFLCMNSCSTGINRKSTAVVFTLENERREIIGKKILPFKVCSCPKRDMGHEDKLKAKKSESTGEPPAKRPKMTCLLEFKVEPSAPSPSTSLLEKFGCTSQAISQATSQTTSEATPQATTSQFKPTTTREFKPTTIEFTMQDVDSAKFVLRAGSNEISGFLAKLQKNKTITLMCQEFSNHITDLINHCEQDD